MFAKVERTAATEVVATLEGLCPFTCSSVEVARAVADAVDNV